MRKKQINAYSLRLDPETEIRAKRQAKKERRSFNAWIQIAVEERLEKAEEAA